MNKGAGSGNYITTLGSSFDTGEVVILVHVEGLEDRWIKFNLEQFDKLINNLRDVRAELATYIQKKAEA